MLVYVPPSPAPIARVRVARRLLDRARGLIGARSLAPDEGLLLVPCRRIHTRFMRLAVLAVHLDQNDRVLALAVLPPGCRGPRVPGTRAVLELHPDRAGALRLGDVLAFRPDPA